MMVTDEQNICANDNRESICEDYAEVSPQRRRAGYMTIIYRIKNNPMLMKAIYCQSTIWCLPKMICWKTPMLTMHKDLCLW